MSAITERYTRDDLTNRQREWLDLFLEGGATYDAGKQATISVYGNYGGGASGSRTIASTTRRLMNHKKIKSILIEDMGCEFEATAIVAAKQLSEIMATGMLFGQPVKPADYQKYMKIALERGAGVLVQRHVHEVTDDRSTKELMAAALEKLSALPPGMRVVAAQKLGLSQEVIDAEFRHVVTEEAPWGYNKDGEPTAKRGRVSQKRFLPGPDAVKPEDLPSDYEKRLARMKQTKLAEQRRIQKEEDDTGS